MIRFSTVLLLLALIFCAQHPAMAQKKKKKTKAEKKEEKKWKKELKSVDPMEYKGLLEERDRLRGENSTLQQEVSGLESSNSSLKSEVSSLKEQVAELKAKPDKPVDRPMTGGWSINPNVGVVFKVQVGAFKGFDITKYFGNNPGFSGEVDDAGTMKYTLGVFKEYWESDKFK